MKKARLSPYYLLLCLPVLLALVGLVWGRPAGGGGMRFDLDDLKGRYVSAEIGYDTSVVHATTTPGTQSPPVFFAVTSVMESNGKGGICGNADGFYPGVTAPGTNLGPAYFHGTYAIDTNGRITATVCSDSAFCATPDTACSPADTTSASWVGYLQSPYGNTVTTVDQLIAINPSTGFLVHSRVWTKDGSEHYY
jgi:hypothetical protein